MLQAPHRSRTLDSFLPSWPLALSTSALRAGCAPPTIPKCSRTRPACSFGGRSLMLSQSRLNRSAAGRGRSRWSPSSGLAFFRYFGGDGGSTYFGGDGGSTAFSFTVERLGSTTGGFRPRPRSSSMVLVSSSMMLGARNAARLPARQRKKYRSGWCQLTFSFRSTRAAQKGGERPAALTPQRVRPIGGG
jgi:hypothetical protein